MIVWGARYCLLCWSISGNGRNEAEDQRDQESSQAKLRGLGSIPKEEILKDFK
jgi:hypothetical protein